MQEFLARLSAILEQVRLGLHNVAENASPGEHFLGALQTLLPFVCGILRVTAILVGLIILFRCIVSLFRERTVREYWGTLTLQSGRQLPLYHWENTLGRSARSDVVLDFPTISRSHAALLRDDKGNWKLHPLQTKNGTKVNGKRVEEPVSVRSGDTITMGGVETSFRAISQEEEREDAMRWGTAERRLSPARTLGYVTVFQLMMMVQCLPGREGPEMGLIGITFAILIVAMWGMYGIYRAIRRTAFEAETLAFFLCTICFSVTAAYLPSNLLRQAICMLTGLVLFFVLSLVLRDLKAVVALRWPVAVFTCLILIFNVVLGQRIFGARNWIALGPISFQPSEFVKIMFIFTGAATLERLFARRNLIFTVLFSGFCMGCLALMSDFGTALIFFVALVVITFLRSGDLGFLAMMGTSAAAGGWLILQFKPYIANRFAAWRHVWEFSTESGGYQQTRTMAAIASGGFFGKGTEGSFLKKLGAANTDLVFGVVSEEFGFLLALIAVACLVVLALFAVKCTANARSSYYVIACNAAAAMMIFQLSLNVLGAVDILPITGVTFPFVSTGGSSMISCWGLMAFLKAADTRPNASLTLKLPKKIRGWMPQDDDLYDEEPYMEKEDYPEEEDHYEKAGYGRYEELEDDFDRYGGFEGPPPEFSFPEDIEDISDSRPDEEGTRIMNRIGGKWRYGRRDDK